MTVTATETTVCQGQPVNLTSTGADTYAWSTGDNGPSISATLTALGLNNIMVIGTNTLSGCTTLVSQNIEVKPSPNVNIYTASTEVCAGTLVHLTAFGASSYSWSNGGNNAIQTATPTGNTTYTVLGSNSSGCIGTAVISLTALPLPLVSASADRPVVCAGETVALTGTGALEYQWVTNDNYILLGSPVVISPTQAGNYTLTGTDANGCSSTAQVAIGIDACTGISSFAEGTSLMVYPNPTSGQLTVESNYAGNEILEITDVTGRILRTLICGPEQTSICLADLPGGIYYARLQHDNRTVTVKIIKQ
jgi:hypothetical protein